jgi:hypothetical protein
MFLEVLFIIYCIFSIIIFIRGDRISFNDIKLPKNKDFNDPIKQMNDREKYEYWRNFNNDIKR